jgi:hypothetical protein
MNNADLKERFAKCETMKAYLSGEVSKIDFYELANACIDEVCGKMKKEDFRGNSDMALWVAQRQNMIREILKENDFENIQTSGFKTLYS